MFVLSDARHTLTKSKSLYSWPTSFGPVDIQVTTPNPTNAEITLHLPTSTYYCTQSNDETSGTELLPTRKMPCCSLNLIKNKLTKIR